MPHRRLRTHQTPERPVSWRRRTVTAMPGINVTRAKINVVHPAVTVETPNESVNVMLSTLSRRTKTTVPIRTNNHHHQYSLRLARPLNVAYFEKTVLMDSANDMGLLRWAAGIARPAM
jgi:hypothetical protein